ncbi:hypothetical protein [Yoonia sp. BS5-3]|uniref:Glycosyl transferase family 2 n=1 Tax=Yoonia phaeophyticola TaxID=3137369 RepID=A0ABZ2V8Z4_9RHOB
MKSTIHKLSSITAPKHSFGTRGLPPQTKINDPKFWDMYDNDTLIFDCVWQAKQGRLRLFVPKLFGFKKKLMASKFVLDGTSSPKPKLRQYRQCDILEFQVSEPVKELAICADDEMLTVPVHQTTPDRFAGKNVIYTKVQNDDLSWIYDWGLAHHRNHGADAVLVTNNASTAYTSDELRATLASIPGMTVADVLESPQRHGPVGNVCRGTGWAKFQQVLCLNVCRDRFFGEARAVLAIDVDELVASRDGTSIFDATMQARMKYIRFGGEWRYASLTEADLRHADHILTDDAQVPCNSKYCIVPDSFLGRTLWSVHSLEHVNRRVFSPHKNFYMLHCHGINTSWKKDRSGLSHRAGPPDPETKAFMETSFAHPSIGTKQ